MNKKGKVLIAASNATALELKGGKQTPAGYYLNELAIPAQALVEAGYELVLATPNGEPPVVDLMQDPDLGEILRHFHDQAKPTALLCHGPIAVTAAMPNARAFRAAMVAGDIATAKAAAAGWQYAGYRMTIFSNDEERFVEQKVLHAEVPFYVVDALEIAGGLVETNGVFEPKVVEDRELITGQNPPSDHMIAARLVAALGRRVQR